MYSDMRSLLGGKKVLVMGLGAHGGGAAAARFCVEEGAIVTVTDLRTEEELAPSLEALAGYDIRYVLGTHREEDFLEADVVIKNPAVPRTSRFLSLARHVETDISLFLKACRSPILAVTGSKGKSTTASALHHILSAAFPGARLGGNITTSPLTFLRELSEETPVVLELSSWQLGDLGGRISFTPQVAALTNIYPDHQNAYASMEAYVEDKFWITATQDPSQTFLYPAFDPWGRWMAANTPATALPFFEERPTSPPPRAAFLTEQEGLFLDHGKEIPLLPERLLVPGAHNRLNLLLAGAMAYTFGTDPALIRTRLSSFPGIPHRLELVREKGGVAFYNDSAATIPDAVLAAVSAFECPVHLITGGTDKNLDLSPYRGLADKPVTVYLLEGSATRRLLPLLEESGISYLGPYRSLEEALAEAHHRASSGEVVLFSPGAASFEMFRHEFHRGEVFRDLVRRL
ncbi:UDP-N-acetylmuramoylalanine--D-glutamate ligase [Spirochaeta thermophila DSM 6578]|uniref:UDP-N-acetylmuramoylalanine--D-glutamate ligase n=1 Tax=Winmispira thermophila (strain ATCC 700085 / DSM 6578 / Z-1203) TaxID=869211 RepID=G0GDW8_WINT7|nr:UDP-N-acetylmuramoyl-L-alanine--D-glutamate ligase [Spirochaeta thermophila]AEJ60600.1 UDP-N-acetylmuramoylalanine--D-glutamate ligase [Spirochaeta thermophila DSM 6578]